MASRNRLSEKEFYLHAFKHRSMLFHLADPVGLSEVKSVIDRLLANHTMVAVCGGPRAGLGRLAHRGLDPGRAGQLAPVSRDLLERGLALLGYGSLRSRAARLRFAVRVAAGLGISKLVIVDPRGGLTAGEERLSFVRAARLARLRAPGTWTAAELELCRLSLGQGVAAVNLTDAAGLERELFTYEGAGTLLTRGQYCRVEKLGVDGFDQALRLITRGEQEGYLLKRTQDERRALLLSAYGAWFEDPRASGLAGLAGLELEAYRGKGLAEVVGLYSITRFKGQGVGKRILERLAEVARAKRRSAMFACSSKAEAVAFFVRNGFERVGAERVPAAKWRGRRHRRPSTVLWRRL